MVQCQDAPATMTIATLARKGEVGIETIRYYQRRSLLRTPARGGPDGGAIRRYNAEDLRQLRFIRAAQAAGFTLEQIAELMTLDATEDRPRALQLANQRIAALDAKIAELQAVRNALRHLAEACDTDTPGPCPIIAAFEHAH